MAEIPMGNFGLRSADPAVQTQVDTRGFGAVNQALRHAAGTGMQLANEAADQQERERRAMKQVEAANAIGQYQLKAETAKQSILDQMREGKVTYDKAGEAYATAMQGVEVPKVDGLDPVMQAQYDGQIGQMSQRGQLSLMPHIEQAKIGKFQSDIDGVLDSQSKQAGLPGANVEEINAGISLMDEQGRMAYGDKWETKKREFIEGNYQNHVQQRLMQAGDNLSELRAIEHDLAASDGYYAEKIDAGKRLGLQNNISNNISRIEQHNEMLATKREVRAMNTLQDIERQNASGIPPTPDMIDNWKTIGSGTAAAGNIEAKIEQGQQIQQFLKVPIEQQQATIQQMETNLMQNGGSVQDKTNLDSLRRVFDANKKNLTESPLIYAQERLGAQVEPIDFNSVMMPGNEAGLSSTLRDRMETVQSLQKKHGAEVKSTLLLPQEVDAFKAQLTGMTPDKQRDFLGKLNAATGGGKEYKALMQQIAPDDPVTAFAGIAASKQNSVEVEAPGVIWGKGSSLPTRDISNTVLTGKRVLEESKGAVTMPGDKDFSADFDEYVGEGFNGQPAAKAAAKDVALAYYAGAVSAGVDPETALNESKRAAVGVVVEHNSKKVIVPYGMDSGSFAGAAKTAFTQSLKAGGLPETLADEFDDYDLESKGNGVYLVKIGNQYLADAQKKPLKINMLGGAK